MAIPYILEINISTIVLMLILFVTTGKAFSATSYDRKLFRSMLIINLVFCVSDIFTFLFDGVPGVISNAIVQISNIVHIEAVVVQGYAWFIYIFSAVGKPRNRRQALLWAIPMILSCVFIALNPLTSWNFTVDDNNVYSRNWGVLFQWAMSWFYIVGGTIRVIVAIVKAPNSVKRRSYYIFVIFIIFPALSSILQILFYGLSLSQVGIALGLIMIYTVLTGYEISSDKLTGLNNRTGMENYVSNLLDNSHKYNLCVVTMDLNDFKQVNDKFGHAVGDEALRDAADILKKTCEKIDERIFICRFGGDEYMFIGRDLPKDISDSLIQRLLDEQKVFNENGNRNYKVDFSAGMAEGECSTYSDFQKLVKQSDERMYEFKRNVKAAR